MVVYEFEHLTITYVPNSELRIETRNGEVVLPLEENGAPFVFQENPNNANRNYRLVGKSEIGLQYYLRASEEHIGVDLSVGIIRNNQENIYLAYIHVPNDAEEDEDCSIHTLRLIGRAIRDGNQLPPPPDVEENNNNYVNNNNHVNNNNMQVNPIVPQNRNLPVNATNAITYAPIANGAEMVNFQEEFGHGRYYTQETYNQLPLGPNGRKKNPYTQANILEPMPYIARIANPIGGKRRSRKVRKPRRKTRRAKTSRVHKKIEPRGRR
jgi:hypothetical protein